MRSSYLKEDVTLLLKDITGLVKPQPTEERERLIQSGKHYSEMLPIEYVPTQKYMEVYQEALERLSVVAIKSITKLPATKIFGFLVIRGASFLCGRNRFLILQL